MTENIVIINRNSGKENAEEKERIIKGVFDREGKLCTIEKTSTVDAADEIIKHYSSQDEPCKLFIMGGDGTLNRAVNSIVPGTSSTLCILRGGTGNDFIRNITNVKDFENVLTSYIYSNITKEIDVGLITSIVGDMKFINITSAGVDSLATSIAPKLKALGPLTYHMSLLVALLKYDYPHLNIKIDGEEIANRKMTAVAICNGTTYGGGIKIAPHALTDDGKFDIYYVNKIFRLRIAALLISILRGHHEEKSYVNYLTGEELKIKADRDMLYNVDGEILSIPANEEVGFQFAKEKLSIIIPR